MTRDNMDGDFQRRISRRFLREYGFYLQRELDDYVRPHDGVSLFRHAMRITASPESTVVTVESVLQIRFEGWIEAATASGFTIFRETNNQSIEQAIAYQFTEQSPADQKRGIHLYEGSDEETMMNICHSTDIHSWSNVQAWQDSTNAIALMLSQRGPKSVG